MLPFRLRLALRLASCAARRAIIMSLKKKEAEWWDGLTKDKTLKRFIKTDFSKWCEEEDPEYTGDIPEPGGGMGGMGGMGGVRSAVAPNPSRRVVRLDPRAWTCRLLVLSRPACRCAADGRRHGRPGADDGRHGRRHGRGIICRDFNHRANALSPCRRLSRAPRAATDGHGVYDGRHGRHGRHG